MVMKGVLVFMLLCLINSYVNSIPDIISFVKMLTVMDPFFLSREHGTFFS